ncbi:antibiotic biosynthesis monooxygenase family protein [Nakamurella endophytica]|uniref:ABM domain-containing protein n=1 Tax=Nakamurella endophytica TaxID=1748367 RepID=A0A917SWU4_9ACTN|nr:antibiotic biosynthesis monooxygenase family protein [Nakamurella endophytica]GGM02033.1 hypothetical protein GCM10011594_22620 [Nakamurella endophytica]
MITSVLQLPARAGDVAAVQAFYERRGILERAERFPGCRAVSLLRDLDPGSGRLLVVAEWDDAAAYARWVADPWRAESSAGLLDLLEPLDRPLVAQLYESVGRGGASAGTAPATDPVDTQTSAAVAGTSPAAAVGTPMSTTVPSGASATGAAHILEEQQ